MFFFLFDAASADHPYAATFVLRLTSGLLALAVLARRPAQLAHLRELSTGTLAALVSIGVADSAAEIFFAVAAGSGLLSVTSVLASLYPVVTVTLALAVLRERVHWLQFCGAATALVGVVLLAQA
jgi:drug/metabolite transporter (DMT)-like permease